MKTASPGSKGLDEHPLQDRHTVGREEINLASVL